MIAVDAVPCSDAFHAYITSSERVTVCRYLEGCKAAAPLFRDMQPDQIFTWFLGKNGLRKDWINYLREQILIPLRTQCPAATTRLVSVLAYETLAKEGHVPTEEPRHKQLDKLAAHIAATGTTDLRIVPTGDFYRWLNKPLPELLGERINRIWAREFIHELSKDHADVGLTIKDFFGERPHLASIEARDLGKAYSALQYLEAYHLVREAYKEALAHKTDATPIKVCFFLPNEEGRYYFSEDPACNAFAEDMNALLHHDGVMTVDTPPLEIHFVSFPWGTDPYHRPYLSRDKGATAADLATLMMPRA